MQAENADLKATGAHISWRIRATSARRSDTKRSRRSAGASRDQRGLGTEVWRLREPREVPLKLLREKRSRPERRGGVKNL
jgi:hypothetical protein